MASKWVPVAVTGLVVLIASRAEHESPGATARSAEDGRAMATPVVSEIVGTVGDALLIARDELGRQGVDPTAVLQAPQTDDSTRDANGIEGG